jgi:hypothetical protein
MGIYLFSKKLGYTRTTITRREDNYYQIANVTRIDQMPVGRKVPIKPDVEVSGYTLIDQDYRLHSFDFSMNSKIMGLKQRIQGEVIGNEIEVLFSDGRKNTVTRRPFDQNVMVSHGFSPFSAMPHLRVGKEWSVSMINPLTLKVESVRAKVELETTIEWQGEEHKVFEVALDYQKFRPKAWITPDGVILKEEIMMPGLYLIKEK